MAEKDKLAKLYDFLKHDVEVSFLDGDVIDVAMDVITKLIDRIKELEKANKDNYWIASDYKIENLKLEQQNKRYREALEFINEELELVLHSNKGLAEKMFYIENSKRKITEVLEGESNEQRTTGRIKKDEVIV